VLVYREGKIFEQEYKIGVPQYDVRAISESEKTGTTIHFWPDDTIFTVTVFKKDILEGRLRELSFLNKGVRITLNDLREKEDENIAYSKTFYSEGGIVEFVEMLDTNAGRNPLIPKTIFVDAKDEFTNVAVEVALVYNDSYSEHIYSYVNNINTIEGGTHVSGFRRALTRVFKVMVTKKACSKKQRLKSKAMIFVKG